MRLVAESDILVVPDMENIVQPQRIVDTDTLLLSLSVTAVSERYCCLCAIPVVQGFAQRIKPWNWLEFEKVLKNKCDSKKDLFPPRIPA